MCASISPQQLDGPRRRYSPASPYSILLRIAFASGTHVDGFDGQPQRVNTDHRSQSRSNWAHCCAADRGQCTTSVPPGRRPSGSQSIARERGRCSG